jgi:hypothetical protein
MAFAKKIGRTRVIVNDEGLKMHDYGHGARVECIDGWNDSCPVVALTVSVEELRDLHYAIGRAIADADDTAARIRR